ncbi:hypothetical protein HYO02_22195 [Vibrio parahaemolyticus]|nr:hypothetical protein [Vibrio parahaemolyticus]
MKALRKSFLIEGEFRLDDPRVKEAVDYLNSACGNTRVLISLPNNRGGHVESAERLIRAIEKTNAFKVELVFSGFAISAAAYVFAYFSFYAPQEHIHTRANKKLCLVYHKPRFTQKNVIVFSNSIIDKSTNDPSKKYLLGITPEFDKVFNEMCGVLLEIGYEIAPHMEAIYNVNGDVSIVFDEGLI